MSYTTQRQIRRAFWREHAGLPGISRKRYGVERTHNTDTRCIFCDFVDALQRGGEISEALADRVTL
jgi:hypothetical protein